MTQGFFFFSPFSVVSENKAVSEAVGHHGWGSHFCDLLWMAVSTVLLERNCQHGHQKA